MDNSEHIEAEKELKRERKSLRNIMATIPDSMLILDRELRIKSANRSFYMLFQTEPGRIIGRKIANILGDRDGKLSAELARLFGTEDTLENFEWHYQSDKLGERILNITARGMIVAAEEEELVVIQDITKRRRVEEALQKSEERYRSLINDVVDTTAVGMFILDPDFKVVWVNRALERYFGLRRNDVIGKDKRHLIREQIKNIFAAPDEFAKRVLATYDNNTYVEHFECHVLPEGEREERWLEHWSQPIRSGLYAGGRIEHYADVTERKRAEEALRESEQRFRTVITNVPIVIFALDREGRFTLSEGKGLQILGLKPGEVVGQSVSDVYSDVPEIVRNIRRALKGEEFTSIVPVGELLFETWYSPIRDQNGEVSRVIGVAIDVTERKRAEEALEESRRFFSGTLNNLLTFIGVLEPNGKVIFVNNTPLKAAGIESKDVIGKIFYDTYWWAYSEEARQTIKKDIERCASGESLVHDIEAQMAGGSLM